MHELPTFDAFYRAVHRGREPFPWQRRLAARVVERGWPSEIGIPTGLGKTGCIDIGVWALAQQAARPPAERSAPTRIWYVVNRRLLVDAAYDHGVQLGGLLRDPGRLTDLWSGATDADIAAIEAVAAALRSLAALGSAEGPLHVVRLRGGADLGVRPPEPSQPALVLATVPMFASRWLFRGFGSSASMRPIDAALAGIDALALLDEAHLARPLVALVDQVAECDTGDPTGLIHSARLRPRLVALTATGDGGDDRFELDAEDLAHPVVHRRVTAAKPVELRTSTRKKLAADLAAAAVAKLEAAGEPTSCVVFANAPATARRVHDELVRLAAARRLDLDLHLLTGRMREREADRARAAVLDPQTGAPSARSAEAPRVRHLVVVATQTLEVGADVDFDHLVTETAGVRALVQRFGRLNRLGQRVGASGVVVHPADAKPDGLYGDEVGEVWARLEQAATAGELLLPPATIADVLGEPDDVPTEAGELLPHHLWEWAKTSVPPVAETPPWVFFEGVDDARLPVSVAWRAYVPRAGERLLPALRGDEAVDVPRYELLDALAAAEVEEVARLSSDASTVELVPAGDLAPGDRVVLPASVGLYDRHGWNPASTDGAGAVLDVSLIRDRMVLLVDDAVLHLAGETVEHGRVVQLVRALVDEPTDDVDDSVEWEHRLVAELIACLRAAPGHPMFDGGEWAELLDTIEDAVQEARRRGEGPVARPLDGPPFLQARRARRRLPSALVRADAFDELSFGIDAASPVLAEHLRSVGEAAAQVAMKLGVDPSIVAVVQRAGELHDLGKLDPRFQRWLDPDALSDVALAKSGTPTHLREASRRAAGWPRGGRHEVLSARLVEAAGLADEPDGDLLVHLVLSHHGHGRPSVPVVDDRFPAKVAAEIEGEHVVISGDLSVPEWDQAARFRGLCERFGLWGVALLEAIVRQADHAVSQFSEVV